MRAPLKLAVALAGATAFVPVAVAWADEQITASPPNRYDNPNVTIDQGERLTFRNNDIREHDVTSSPDPELFHSQLIGNGQTSFVEGSQYLTTGSYDFVCSVHLDMKGTLTVTSAGTPVPRPGSGGPPPADATAPSVSVSAKRIRRSSLARSRKLRVGYGVSEAATVRITLKQGSRTLGSTTFEGTVPGGAVNLRLRSKPTRKRLTLSISAKDTAGNVGRGSFVLRLR